MLQLGWKAGTEQYEPDELLDYAIVAEETGFDSIDASDHFHPWAEKGQAGGAGPTETAEDENDDECLAPFLGNKGQLYVAQDGGEGEEEGEGR